MKPTYLFVPLALAACALPAAAPQPRPRAEACVDTLPGKEGMTREQLRAAELERSPEPTPRAAYRLTMLQERLLGFVRQNQKRPERLFEFADSVAEVPWLSTCDPWRHRVVYTPREDEYELRSAGPDGILKTDDDIVQTGLLPRVSRRAAAPGAGR